MLRTTAQFPIIHAHVISGICHYVDLLMAPRLRLRAEVRRRRPARQAVGAGVVAEPIMIKWQQVCIVVTL